MDLYGYTSMAVAALKVQAAELAELRRQVADLSARLPSQSSMCTPVAQLILPKRRARAARAS